MVLCLAKHNAISNWRKTIGPTDTKIARQSAPKSLRALYGTDNTRNAFHGSANMDDARREVKFFFPTMSMEPILNDAETGEYIRNNLQDTLMKGLTELVKQKPAEPVKWLAYWMLDNNPNKPRFDEEEN